MGKASTNRELTIHRYHRVCDIAHKTWSGDYQQVRQLTAREVQVFINTHTTEYLKLFCEHTPVFETFVELPDYRGINYRVQAAITQHCTRDAWEGEDQ
jgi:hypothetical protein